MNRRRKRYIPPAPAYPNQASEGYLRQRLLDGITCVVTGMGVVAIFIFFITL